MIQLYNVVEFLATFTELFVAYLVLRTIFYDKRKLTNYYIDAIMAASGTIMVLCCNKIALFSLAVSIINFPPATNTSLFAKATVFPFFIML